MITINNSDNSLEICGHAKYAEAGKDIVCSAVSMLAQNFILSVKSLTNDVIYVEMSNGCLRVNYENLSESAQILKDSLFIGLRAIAEDYPEHINLTEH